MHPVFVYLVVMAVTFAVAGIVANSRMTLNVKVRSYKMWRKRS